MPFGLLLYKAYKFIVQAIASRFIYCALILIFGSIILITSTRTSLRLIVLIPLTVVLKVQEGMNQLRNLAFMSLQTIDINLFFNEILLLIVGFNYSLFNNMIMPSR